MDEKKYKLNIHTAALSLPAEHAEKLLSLGDGEAALLYLYILRAGGSLDEEKAAADLGRTRTAVQVAARALDRAGLFAAGEAPLPPPEELPEYTAEDIVARSEGDPAFKALIAECRRVMGRGLSTADLKTLFARFLNIGDKRQVRQDRFAVSFLVRLGELVPERDLPRSFRLVGKNGGYLSAQHVPHRRGVAVVRDLQTIFCRVEPREIGIIRSAVVDLPAVVFAYDGIAWERLSFGDGLPVGESGGGVLAASAIRLAGR